MLVKFVLILPLVVDQRDFIVFRCAQSIQIGLNCYFLLLFADLLIYSRVLQSDKGRPSVKSILSATIGSAPFFDQFSIAGGGPKRATVRTDQS